MGYYPPEIRSYLFGNFAQAHSGDWSLSMSPFYADLFEDQEPELYEMCIGWRPSSTNPSMVYTYFKGIDDEDVKRIQTFRSDYGNYMLVGKNDLIAARFNDELDACIAVDKHYVEGQRSEIGELIYRAKYQNDGDALDEIIDFLVPALKCTNRFRITEQARLSYIPPNPAKDFDIPKYLTEELATRLDPTFFGNTVHRIVHSRLKIAKPPMKDAGIEQKFVFWLSVVHNQQIEISEDVRQKTVFVIDDLYQSGVTLWAYAKFLKARGADRVIGLVCTKTKSDTDNTTLDTHSDIDNSWTIDL